MDFEFFVGDEQHGHVFLLRGAVLQESKVGSLMTIL